MAESNFGRKGFILLVIYSLSSKEVRVGTQGRNLEAGADAEAIEAVQSPWKGAESMEVEASYWFADHGLLSLISYRTQDH